MNINNFESLYPTNPQKKALCFLRDKEVGFMSNEYNPNAETDWTYLRGDKDSILIDLEIKSKIKGMSQSWAFEITQRGKIIATSYPYHVMYNDDPEEFYGMTFM